MQLESQRPEHRLDFSLTSVNIVFLLLLFFLTAGTLMQDSESAIRAPRTETLPLDRLPRPLLVVNRDGSLFLDGNPTSVETLPSAAEGAPRSPGGLPVLHVMPDRDLAADRFLQTVEAIRDTGLWTITLVTIRE